VHPATPSGPSEVPASAPEVRAGAPAAPAAARTLLLAASAVLTVLLASLVSLLPVPYVALSPGPVRDVTAGASATSPGLITIKGHPTYPTDGQLDFTTVSLRGGPSLEMSLPELLADWRDPDVSVVPRAAYFPPEQTKQQADAESSAEMTGSQESAKVAALTELGIAVPSTTTLRVASVDPAAPAAAALSPGDLITSVDGRPVADFEALRAAVTALAPGAAVQLGVMRSGAARTVATTTYAVGGATRLGVAPEVDHTFPFSIDIAIDHVGGPSAGTMFALGIIDELTPGSMTGGQHIAGTGTIDVSGAVGVIGGLRQKVLGARAQGARWFLAPAPECAQVAGATPAGITVVPITTLDGARAAVEAIGAGRGASLATCG